MKTKYAISFFALAAIALAQATKPATPKQPAGTGKASTPAKTATAAKASGKGEVVLPTRATVESFLHSVFGWDTQVKITVKEIKWSPAATLAQVDIHAETAKGPGDSSIFVTSDHKTAIVGQLFPFGGLPGAKPTQAQLDAFVKQMTNNNPRFMWSLIDAKPNGLDNLMEVTLMISNPQGQRGSSLFWITPDGQHALVGEASPFGANPFAAAQAQLVKGINGPAKGPAASPILIVEFGDLECPSCKAAAPVIDRLLKEVPTARLVFQQFPLVQIHHWAYKAAQYGDCISRQNNDAYWKFMDAVYAVQEDISSHVESSDPNKKPDVSYAEQKLTELTGGLGVDAKQVAACAADPATAIRVDRSMALGTQMQVTGTPTLFINGRRIANLGGLPYESLKKITEFQGSPQK